MASHQLYTGEWYLLELNPEPWTAPEAGIGRRNARLFVNMYKNEQLRAFQEAVIGTMEEEYPNAPLHTGLVELEFFFWRQLPAWTTDSDRIARKHQSDATNLQKALEDALEGILFTNDRNVVAIHSTIVEQSPDTSPRILIGIHDHQGHLKWPLDKADHLHKAKIMKRHPAKKPPLPPDDDLF